MTGKTRVDIGKLIIAPLTGIASSWLNTDLFEDFTIDGALNLKAIIIDLLLRLPG
ncbi:MAG: hypothetical protein AAFQ87_08515 [Bacteroidota bacterium]